MKRSSIRLQYNAPVTLTFFFLSLASLVLGYLTNNWTTSHLFSVYRSSMTDPLFYVRLFGHVLGHGGWDHFINNMLLFLVVAPPLEERYGSRTLLSGILMTALVSFCSERVAFTLSGRVCIFAVGRSRQLFPGRMDPAKDYSPGDCSISAGTSVVPSSSSSTISVRAKSQ